VGWIAPTEPAGTTWEQHEIELGLSPLPAAADAVVLAQWVLRNLARAEGAHCSFEPVIRRGHAGTGLHFHFSPAAGGRALDVRGADGRLSPPARLLVGGLVMHGAALMAFGNRVAGSFVRTGQAKEAPDTIRWGEYDRSALVRLPVVARDPDGRPVSPPTIEFRLPDGSAHPHLLLAGVAQAMLAAMDAPGLDARLEATASAPTAGGANAPGGPTRVPTTFAEVAHALAAGRALFEAGGVFPAAMLDAVHARLAAEATPAT
jgi:glutamine synthetase